MARIDVKEIGLERLVEVIAEPESEHLGVERNDVVDVLGGSTA